VEGPGGRADGQGGGVRGAGPGETTPGPGSGHHAWNEAHRFDPDALKKISDQVWEEVENPSCLPEIADPKKKAYVLALALTGTKFRAAQVACIGPSTPYSAPWRRDDVLQVAIQASEEAAADLIEAEAFRRGVEGTVEPIGWYKGNPGGMVRRYSDVLNIFLLKGLRPDKYKDRVQMQGALANLDLNQLPDEAIERIARGENIMSVLASLTPAGLLPAVEAENPETPTEPVSNEPT
jgi:hypothetical protein